MVRKYEGMDFLCCLFMHLKVMQVAVPIRLRLITQPGFYLEFGEGFKVTRLVICS